MAPSFEHISDKSFLAKLEEEERLLAKDAELRKKQDEARLKFDEKKKELKPEVEAALQKKDDEIQALYDEKDALFAPPSAKEQLERLRRQREMDERIDLIRQARPLRDQGIFLRNRLNDATMKAEVLAAKVAKAAEGAPSKKRSVLEAEEQAAAEEEKRARATKNHAVIAKAVLARKQVRTQLDAAVAVDELQAEFDKTAAEVHETNEKLVANEKAQVAAEEKVKALSAKLGMPVEETKEQREEAKRQRDEERKQRDAEYEAKKKLRDEKAKKINKKIDEKKEEKREILKKSGSKEHAEEMDKLKAEREELRRQLNELNESIDKAEVELTEEDMDLLAVLVGPNGANLTAIQTDHEVLVDIRRRERNILVRGPNADDCAEAIRGFLKTARENRHMETTTIDADMRGDFIGPRGEHIKMLTTTTGAKIDMDEGSEGVVKVVGNKESVALAMELINKFKAESFKATVSFPRPLDPVMRPSLMVQWQSEYNVPSIRVDRNALTITIRGREDLVQAAKEAIEGFVSSYSEVRVPSSVNVAALIGKGGETIRTIQNATGALLDVKDVRVLIAGAAPAVAEAKKMVEAIIAENETKEVKIPFKPKLRDFLMRRRFEVEFRERKAPKQDKHADPAANGAAGDEEPAAAEPAEKPATELVGLVEKLKREHNMFMARLETPPPRGDVSSSFYVIARGPVLAAGAFERDLRKAMAFEGLSKEIVNLSTAMTQYLTQNLLPRGSRDTKTRIDPVREVEGVEEVIADHRYEPTRVEIYGTAEGVAAGKARLDKLRAAGQARSHTFEIPSYAIGRVLGPRWANAQEVEEKYRVMLHAPSSKREDRSIELTLFATAPPPEGVDLAAHLKQAEDELTREVNN